MYLITSYIMQFWIYIDVGPSVAYFIWTVFGLASIQVDMIMMPLTYSLTSVVDSMPFSFYFLFIILIILISFLPLNW